MEFRVLGPLEVEDQGRLLQLGGPAERHLLAVLVCLANEVVSTGRLIDELWGDEPPATARNMVQRYVSRLRRSLGASAGERLVTEAGGYRLCIGGEELDWFRFESLVARARDVESPDVSAPLLREALAMWRGPPLVGAGDGATVVAERVRWEEAQLAALEERIDCDLELGLHRDLVPELEALTGQIPLRERLQGQLMVALYRSDRQSEALRAYADYQQRLGEETGLEPSPALVDLEDQILVRSKDLDPPAVVPSFPRSNLPHPLTDFIGRQSETNAVVGLVGEHRLVTLTGAAGIGKTSLAIRAASELLGSFPEGVWFADLVPASDADGVSQVIADTLGIQLSGGINAVETLSRSLRTQSLLIVLDNFEHVIEAAPLLSTLLEAAADLRMLVTSRERLRLSGEQVFRVPPLGQSDATLLFLRQAQAIRPGFNLADDNTEDIAAICADLDGLPLAIQLAAARVDVLAPAALRERLSSRLATLTGGLRDHPKRQQTLRDTIDWSYDMLQPDEQQLFASLAVFNGGLSLEAVEAVCGPGLTVDVLEGLQSLTDKSLIQQHFRPDGEPRFFLLATIHEYAREVFNTNLDTQGIRHRHCDYFTNLAQRAEPKLYGADWDRWFGILAADAENLRAALTWAFTQGDPLQGCRLFGALNRSWVGRADLGEILTWKNEALQHADALEPLARARFYLTLGWMALDDQHIEDVRRFCSDALRWAQVAGDDGLIARSMLGLGVTYVGDSGNYDRAMTQCRQAAETARTADEPGATARALVAMGELARSQGDDEAAAQAYEAALQIWQDIGDKFLATGVLGNLTFIAEHRGDHQAAQHLAASALTAARELESPALTAFGLEVVAIAATSVGKIQRGARLLGAADRALEVIGVVRGPGDQPEYDRTWAKLAQQLKPAELEALITEGRAMTLPEAVTHALEEDPAPLGPADSR